VSLRANAAATEALYAAAEISTAKYSDRRGTLALAAAHLDDVELESSWQAALRGDYIVGSSRLTRTATAQRTRKQKHKRGDTPWRLAFLPQRRKVAR
jgi:hypothetical protein